MDQPFIGMIALYGFSWAPRGWALCEGQLVAINQNQALFALIGTTFGGNGTTTFALPDLRGRAAVGAGTGNGLTPISPGEAGGHETVTLTQANLPAHTHAATVTASLHAESVPADRANPNGAMLAGAQTYALPDPANDRVMASESLDISVTNSSTGGSQPFAIRSPFLGMNYSIALEGIFPSRN